MNISKAIVALSIALASPVAAESWDLGTVGNWHLRMSENSEGLECGMDNMPEGRADFSISVNSEGVYFLLVTNSDPAIVDAESIYDDVDFKITSSSMNKTWTLRDALLFSQDQVVHIFVVIGEDPYQRDFMSDIVKGDMLRLPGNKEDIATWTLGESATAVEMLETCRMRIMGEL
jgi:hypothetical protein